MKIWIDILTPKQLLFFEPIIKKLRKKHVVICTGRKYRELSNLSKIRKFKLIFIGSHGGKERDKKLKASISRMANIQAFIEKQKPDLTISFCSPEAARISFGLGIKHIGFSDSPHATAVMKLYVPLIQKLLIPAIIPKTEFIKFGINNKDIIKYNAIDAASIAKRDISKKEKPPYDKNKKTILIRVEEEHAAYIKKKKNVELIINELAKNIQNTNVVVLARYNDQIKKLKKKFDKKIKVLTKSYDGKILLMNTDVFIGSGGTMTAESALLGIPTISYNAVPNLIEEFLVRKNIVKRESNHKQILKITEKILRTQKTQYLKKAKKIMKQMEDPYVVLVKTMKNIE